MQHVTAPPKRRGREELYTHLTPERKPAATGCCPGEKQRTIALLLVVSNFNAAFIINNKF